MSNNQNKANNSELLFYLLLLTGFFILFEISFFIQCNKQYVFEIGAMTNHISIPATILPEILIFVLIQIGLHAVYCLMVWFSVVYSGYLFTMPRSSYIPFAILLWFAGILFVLSYNQIHFPNSKYADLTSMLLPAAIAGYVAIGLGLFCSIILCCALFGFLLYSVSISVNCLLCFVLFVAGGSFAWQSNYLKPIAMPEGMGNQPNVLIIGIDSLRPDILGYFGGSGNSHFLDGFLAQSSVFTDAVTPLARTFPSWISILTGKYPKENGVRSNLTSLTGMELSRALPVLFKQHGYQTVYATDETRFSNIDNSFGFDTIISPPIGLNDFLLGTFNDFPISNLLVNTSLGKWLFPYSHANRPAIVTYQPDTFLGEIKKYLLQPRKHPLFMAVHFCLPHFPYVWADLVAKPLSIRERYLASIGRVDEQVAGFFHILDQAGLLKHTIVVLLSDHGEALELPGDRITENDAFVGSLARNSKPPVFYPRGMEDEDINQTAGHGTDVLALPQYHSLLAIRLFGLQAQKHRDISGAVSLIDIKPTILHLAGFESAGGQSLVSSFNGGAVPLRHIYMESDYSPESVRTIHPDIKKTMLQGAHLFRVDPATTRLHLKPEMLSKIMESKQYADIYGVWILALYPQPDHDYQTILVNLESGQWTNNLSSDFAIRSPAKSMLFQLKNYISQK